MDIYKAEIKDKFSRAGTDWNAKWKSRSRCSNCGREKENYLHLESKLHTLLDGAHVDSDHPVDKSFLIDVFILALLEQAEKSIVDIARQIRVLEESDLVNELEFVVCLLWTMPSHRDIWEDRLKVGPDFLLKKLPV